MEHFYHDIEGWASEGDQGKLLTTILPLIKQEGQIKIAEIGVYQGRGTSIWNTILINENVDYEYKAIDHFEGSAEHDKSINYYEITLENFKSISEYTRSQQIYVSIGTKDIPFFKFKSG